MNAATNSLLFWGWVGLNVVVLIAVPIVFVYLCWRKK